MKKKKISMEELPAFVKAEMGRRKYARNWEHGWPHVVRVWKHLELLLLLSPVREDIARLLKIAVLVHDIRRDEMVGHAEASAKYFDNIEIEGLGKEEKEDVCYAVRNHSRGMKRAAGSELARRDVLLSLLCMLDHMDAMGLTDLLRIIQWQQSMELRMDVFGKIPARKMRRIFESGERTTVVDGESLKEDSYLGHLLFNYQAMEEIIAPVRGMLSSAFLARLKMMEMHDLLEEMISLQEQNEESFEKDTIVF